MIHSPEAIAKVIADTGMGEMQARYHLDGCAAVRASMRNQPYRPAPRSFIVTPDTSYLRGYRETVHVLRCYGSGVGVIASGISGKFRNADEAIRKGQAWVDAGISPCHQGMDHGECVA